MFYGIAGYEGTGAAQSCFAMHCDCSWFFLSNRKKLKKDVLWWAGTISKIKLIVTDASLLELGTIVGLIVEAYDCSDSHFFEDRDVVFWGEI